MLELGDKRDEMKNEEFVSPVENSLEFCNLHGVTCNENVKN